MSKSSKNPKGSVPFKILNAHAGSVDIGSRSNWASIGLGTGQSKEFGVFTCDHHELCKWFKTNGVKTVAMESTGYYWKQLFIMLQSYGMEVYLVNASYTKNIRARKPSDLADSQWIWKMHTVGLLPASFQPDFFTDKLRIYSRHRKGLIEGASRCINRMQKSLVLMNLQLPVVLSDIMGKSGQRIIQAILSGERDGSQLAKLADPRVKADRVTIAKALTGHWKAELLFELEQNWQLYHFHQQQIEQCDEQIDQLLQQHVEQTGQAELVYEGKKKNNTSKNAPSAKIQQFTYQMSDGIDLSQIEGVGLDFMLTLLSETGLDLSAFPTAKHFASWLGFSPNKKVSGGKVLSSKTKKNKSRLAQSFRQAAVGVSKKKDTPLAHFYRRISYRKSKKVAVVATARKLAVIVYNMLQNKQSYQLISTESYQQKLREHKFKQIQRTISKFGFNKEELVDLIQ